MKWHEASATSRVRGEKNFRTRSGVISPSRSGCSGTSRTPFAASACQQ